MKAIASLIIPNIGLWLVFAAAIFGWVRRGRASRNRALIAAIGILLVLSFPAGPRLAADIWRLPVPEMPWAPAGAGTAVFVFGGGIDTDGYAHFWPSEASMRRVSVGRMIAAESGVPLMVSGGPTSGAGPTEAKVIADMLATEKFDVLRDDTALNTWDNAVAARAALDRYGWISVYAVTDAIHGRRAVACLRAVGVPVAGFRAPRRESGLTAEDFIPSVRGLAQWGVVGYEFVASVVYLMKGRIELSDLHG